MGIADRKAAVISRPRSGQANDEGKRERSVRVPEEEGDALSVESGEQCGRVECELRSDRGDLGDGELKEFVDV